MLKFGVIPCLLFSQMGLASANITAMSIDGNVRELAISDKFIVASAAYDNEEARIFVLDHQGKIHRQADKNQGLLGHLFQQIKIHPLGAIIGVTDVGFFVSNDEGRSFEHVSSLDIQFQPTLRGTEKFAMSDNGDLYFAVANYNSRSDLNPSYDFLLSRDWGKTFSLLGNRFVTPNGALDVSSSPTGEALRIETFYASKNVLAIGGIKGLGIYSQDLSPLAFEASFEKAYTPMEYKIGLVGNDTTFYLPNSSSIYGWSFGQKDVWRVSYPAKGSVVQVYFDANGSMYTVNDGGNHNPVTTVNLVAFDKLQEVFSISRRVAKTVVLYAGKAYVLKSDAKLKRSAIDVFAL